MDRHTWFYRGMGCLTVVLTIAGFAPGLLTPAHPRQPLTALVAVHAGLCIGWLALFLAQTSMVAARRTDLHRRLGVLGGLLAVGLVVTGYFTAIGLARRGIALSGDPATARDPVGELVFPLGDLLTFAVLMIAGLLWRRRRAAHARLMLFATLGGLMPAALAHVIGYFPAVRDRPIFVVSMLALLYASHAVHDKITVGRIHPLSLWVGLGVFVWANLRAGLIGPSDAWHRFVGWLIA